MNNPLLHALLGVRVANLGEADERVRIAEFVRSHPDASPFHLPEWSIAVARGCGQRAHMLVAEGADGSLVGVLPLTETRSPLFGRALVSAGFAVGGGILARNEGAISSLGSAAWDLAEKLRCPTLDLRGGPVAGGAWVADDTTYLGFTRPLAGDDEAELAAIPRKQRAEVRKALASDLDLTIGNGPNDARDHYSVYAESVRNLGTPVFPRALFQTVLDEFGDAADILTILSDGEPVASVLSLYFNGTVFPYWGGGTHAARALRANDAMYFSLMAHARARGCKHFDFGRSKAGTGAAAFKKNWGFEPEPLVYYRRTAAGGAPRDINPSNPRYRLKVEAWKRLPLWAANRVGPMISRGLG
jgi:FemAB-related protein (PEP-CTERM system-associated)